MGIARVPWLGRGQKMTRTRLTCKRDSLGRLAKTLRELSRDR